MANCFSLLVQTKSSFHEEVEAKGTVLWFARPNAGCASPSSGISTCIGNVGGHQ
jgi:hypothetical protein